jgi:two-component system, NarL family, captular synthesis response regulator RcsB
MTSPVVIADDQPVVVAGVEAALKKHLYTVVATVNDTDTLLQTLTEVDCEVLIVDPFMPDGTHPDSVGLVRRIRALRPDIGIVVMSRLGNLPALRHMLDIGVAALFDKSASLRGITMAVHAASIGRAFLSPAVRRAFRDMDRVDAEDGPSRQLTPREVDVLRAYARGLSLAEVGQLMTRSIKTISRQKRSAMAKLGLRNDAQLYQYLANVRSGLIECVIPPLQDGESAAPDEPVEDDEDDEAYVETKKRPRTARHRAPADEPA